jgi:hypothetical protein
MKTIILLTVLFGLIGCSSLKDTTHQAKLDWQNLNNTIRYNAKQPVVLKTAYF